MRITSLLSIVLLITVVFLNMLVDMTKQNRQVKYIVDNDRTPSSVVAQLK